MELFYAQPAANGSVDWKPAGQKFRETLRPSRIELTIDAELGKRIAAIKVPEYPKPELPVLQRTCRENRSNGKRTGRRNTLCSV